MPTKRKVTLEERIAKNLARLPAGVGQDIGTGDKVRMKRCSCNTSVMVPPMPQQHCVACHHSWNAKKPAAANRCPDCFYNLKAWRARLNVTVPEVGFDRTIRAIPQEEEGELRRQGVLIL